MQKLLLILGVLLLCTASAGAEPVVKENMTWYRLHFGMGVGTDAITPELFHSFLDKQVTPLFPEGLTMTSARGQWHSPKVGLIREKTTVVDLNCEESQECQKKIDTIAEAYTKRFRKAKASIFVIKIPGVSTILQY